MKRIITLLLLSAFLFSQDNYEDLFSSITDSSSESTEESPLTISGEHEFSYELPYGNSEYLDEGNLKNNFTITYQNEDIYILSELKYSSASNKLSHNENYIKLLSEKYNLILGYREFTWGFADEINPTDYLNPREFEAPTDIDKIAALSLCFDYYFTESISIETAFLPTKEQSELYFTESEIEAGIQANSPMPATNVTFKDNELDLDYFVVGGKLNFYGSTDISLSYIYDLDRYYYAETELILPTTANVTAYRQRVHRLGLSTKTNVGIFGLWLEGNYSLTEDSNDYLEWVVGGDFNYGADEQGTINFQAFGSWIVDYSEDQADIINNSLQSYRDEFTIGGTLSIDYGLKNDEIIPEVKVIYTSTMSDVGSIAIKPAIDYAPMDSLSIKLSFTYHETWDDNPVIEMYEDRITLSTTFSW